MFLCVVIAVVRFVFMRTCIALFILLLASCTSSPGTDKNNDALLPLAGSSWLLVYSYEAGDDTVFHHVPPSEKRIKTFTQNRFVFTGYDFDSSKITGMGGGIYRLKDSMYEEEIEFHHHTAFNGKKFQAVLRFDNDFLYQKGIVDSLRLEEKWRRID